MNHAYHVGNRNRACDVIVDPQVVMFAEAEAGGIDTIDCAECLACMAQVYEKLAAALRARIKPATPTCAAMPVVASYRGGGVPPGEWIEVTTDDPRLPRRGHRVQRLVVSKECRDWRIDRIQIDDRVLIEEACPFYGFDFPATGKCVDINYGEGFAFLIRATNTTNAKAPFLACWLVDPDPDIITSIATKIAEPEATE